MHQDWITNLDKSTALLVPTRSLANTLNEQVAEFYIEQGKTVWEAPNILIWRDYIKELWALNKPKFNQYLGAKHLISSQQSLLLWTQVIEKSRRQEQALTLLNVQQTARAVQRSWTLMHDWRIEIKTIEQDHDADSVQFVQWLKEYQALLNKRGLLDEPLLLNALCDRQIELEFPYQELIYYAFDLINATQDTINQCSKERVEIKHLSPPERDGRLSYHSYKDTNTELIACFQSARKLIEEQPDCTINIVIHDLQDRQAKVDELARQVFYPSASPLEVQKNSTAFRYSLGQRLTQWAAIDTALSVINLLKNRTTTTELSFLLRNQFLGLCAEHRQECRAFDRWLKRQRVHNITLEQLPDLYQQCLASLQEPPKMPDENGFAQTLDMLVQKLQDLRGKLNQEKQNNQFSALSFTDWVNQFSDWLATWGWSSRTVGNELNTVQHQLLKRWESLLQEFAALAAVQRKTGLSKAIDLLTQMARDAMFIPKAAASPILISSILEAVGRPADYCFVLGMSESFPPAPKNDAFIPQRLLASAGHPDMSADSSFVQAQTVMNNLLNSMGDTVISYANQTEQDHEISQQCSPLFRHNVFTEQQKLSQFDQTKSSEAWLEHYQDLQGPVWQSSVRASGGSKVFENQSHCPFKAFVTHQLTFQVDQEAEFGLDFLDRGNVVHLLLDRLWERLQTQQQLKQIEPAALKALINQLIDQALGDKGLELSEDKQRLLSFERPRLVTLLTQWLDFEAKRPEPFMVIEREEMRQGELAGIEFSYIIDRLDMTDDGRTFIIDYKTGSVNKKDWVGKPLKSPQMPLYAVALSKAKNNPISGIAYANVRQHEHKFVELSEAGVFRKQNKRTLDDEALWNQNKAQWENLFTELAGDFLAGNAAVEPIDEGVCDYCDLQSMCRISQLRKQSIAEGSKSDD
ncbi:MAG: PD-(D/E)XK nuclease family protein [Acidiferrobacterales bacterium]|nr:PD-(D/E)XK nuclease family protein [Acidiferrobacterales bacterium]